MLAWASGQTYCRISRNIFHSLTSKFIILWRTETKVLRNPGQIFPDLCEDCVSVVAASSALHGGAEAPGDNAHQRPAVVGSVLSHERPPAISLAAASLVGRRLAGTQLLPVDLEGEVREVGHGVPEVEQLRAADRMLPSSLAAVRSHFWCTPSPTLSGSSPS